MMQSNARTLAPAFSLFPSLKPPHTTLTFHRFLVLIITFFAYASFHASRKPPSIVKSILGPTVKSNSTLIETGWPPFNGPEGTHRLGEIDFAFLISYAVCMYVAGHKGDRKDLRLFLVFGMMGSGIFTIMFGLGYWLNVHFFVYFFFVQVFCGGFQSIGWPCVVAVVGNWCGKDKRGLIMGVWNSHTSLGNIVGSLVASAVLEFGWGWSFLVPGVLVILVGILVFMFLVVSPEDLGFEPPGKEVEMNARADGVENSGKVESEQAGLLGRDDPDSAVAIGFFEACRLPGVAPFACCLFFSKLVAYTFLYWLPFYIRHTAVAGVHLSDKTAGVLSIIFDIGGVFGGVLAGYISDRTEARASTSLGFLITSIPMLILYRTFGSLSMIANVLLMFLSGLCVNGPYSLITTAVAADLGTQDSIKGNSRALATVTAIIDGTGSLGAALGPPSAGYMSSWGWNSVFSMLVFATTSAGFCLTRLATIELKEKLNERRQLLDSSVTTS